MTEQTMAQQKLATAAVLLACTALAAGARDPRANPASVVVAGNGSARFTVLTSRLLRLEWAADGAFEDRETLVVANRNLPAPNFTVTRRGGGVGGVGGNDALTIENEFLRLDYEVMDGASSRFTPHNLRVVIKATGATWHPGRPAGTGGNLLGTVESLDGVTGGVDLNCSNATGCAGHDPANPVPGTSPACRYCAFAPIAREGWATFNDLAAAQSGNATIDTTSGWIVPDARAAAAAAGAVDTYLFAHGLAYHAALGDLALVSGAPGRVPREVLGAWWSRYWPYTAEDLQDIAEGYRRHSVPLDVVVSDMAWHYHNETPVDWAGYGWSEELFPEPALFRSWLESQRMNFTLNLHLGRVLPPPATPAAAWANFVRALVPDPERWPDATDPGSFRTGLPCCDPRFNKPHTFGCDAACVAATGGALNYSVAQGLVASPAFAAAYLALLDSSGTRLQWLDDEPRWVARVLHGHSRKGGGVGWRDAERAGTGLAFSRWAGLGSHRYPIGFSGDTYTAWESLAFQPYFTATAANVMFWWSHDIGGHRSSHDAETYDPELYLRWLQFGAHSPVLRTHPQPDPLMERRPWAYALPYSDYMLAAFARRAQLVPLLHTKLLRFAEGNSDGSNVGVSPLRPLYHDYPELDGAYKHRDTYLLADDLIVAPITSPVGNATKLASRTVWLPPGAWVELTSGTTRVGALPSAAASCASCPALAGRTDNAGGVEVTLEATIDETPVFARAGAVLALAPSPTPLRNGACSSPSTIGSASVQPEQLLFEVYPGSGAHAAHRGRGEERVDSAFGRDDTTTGSYEISDDGSTIAFTATCASAQGAEGAPSACQAMGSERRVYRLELKFVAPAHSVDMACGNGDTNTELLGASYDATTLTQIVTFRAAPAPEPVHASQRGAAAGGPVTACVRVMRRAGSTSFTDGIVSESRYVQLRRRAHRLKALVDVQVTRPTQATMPLAIVVNTAARIEAHPDKFEQELGTFNRRVVAAVSSLDGAGCDANLTAIARAWMV